MNGKIFSLNQNFVGREREIRKLRSLDQAQEASIVVVHGRRRVGKTELLEQTFRTRNVLKFEGLEGQSEAVQRQNLLEQFAAYVGDPLIGKLKLATWREAFELIAMHAAKGKWTIYLEEVQWMANYSDRFISELKYVWDNYFRNNKQLILILCGSSPSFMIGKVIHSKALYNRSQHEIPLREFNLVEASLFLGKRRSARQVMDAYLSVGGIPEYLKYIKAGPSLLLALCEHAFLPGGFFVEEHERIFVSSLSSNKHYRKIIEFLAKRRFASRRQIAQHLKIDAGGSLSDLLRNLEQCGFIEKYAPYNLSDDGQLVRFAIADYYLQFYYAFIKPIQADIRTGRYQKNPLTALNMDRYNKWLGFAFERWCRRHHYVLASVLGFGSIRYEAGAYFRRPKDTADQGYQIDLIFDRADHVMTVCEIKYLQSHCTPTVIREMENKLSLFQQRTRKTIEKVLITTEGPNHALAGRAYFDRVITLTELFDTHYW